MRVVYLRDDSREEERIGERKVEGWKATQHFVAHLATAASD